MTEVTKNNKKTTALKGFIIPLLLLILGIVLIFGSDSILNLKKSESYEATEQRLVMMINDLDGVSDSNVMILFDDSGDVKGVAVICSGGEEYHNQKNIIDLITSLFGIGASDVFVGGR